MLERRRCFSPRAATPGELAVTAGPWPAGGRVSAWCVAHYRLVDGRIAEIEQHDCYDQERPPQEPRA